MLKMTIFVSNGPVFDNDGSKLGYSGQHFGLSVGCYCFHSALISHKDQGQLLEGVECHIYLYCFTFDDMNLNRALVIIVLFPTKYSNKKVCANDIRK